MRAEPAFWSEPIDALLRRVGSSAGGLSSDEAQLRLSRFGPNAIVPHRARSTLGLLLGQFKSPIVLVLLSAALLSTLLGGRTDSLIIFGIVLVSALLGFWQEHRAAGAIEALLATVRVHATVVRDGAPHEIPLHEVVPGDVVELGAGDVVPGDCRLLEGRDLFAEESALTGESFPADKAPGIAPPDAPLARRTCALYLGTHVVSGTGRALVVRTGAATEFGHIAARLRLRPPETDFERGVRRFGQLLLEVTLVLVMVIFALNVYFHRPVLESFLFAVALAVGLTPQLLPAIISVNLAHGARRMAAERVIVKRLSSIENFGSMDLLCTDKTGTLTEGVVALEAALDPAGRDSPELRRLAYLNAVYESGFRNPIDEALRAACECDISGYQKLDEVPYDFVRRRLSVLAATPTGHLLVTKGALSAVLDVCALEKTARIAIERRAEALGQAGKRVLALGHRDLGPQPTIAAGDEHDLVFDGLLVFAAPPKRGIRDTLARLRTLGIRLQIVTGDAAAVATALARELLSGQPRVVTGAELDRMNNRALQKLAPETDVFAEVAPHQKERIVRALRQAGHVVGYMGDGINDVSALHAADVGISVSSGVDVAKEAADIVLLEKDLDVLTVGVEEGRTTFANTLKYVFMATSANFGNMFSMAGASLFLPFLPLLPKQVLLANLLTDLPEMAIAQDSVDPELVERPRRWDIARIRRFMFAFGLLSSVFDYLTFGALLFIGAKMAEFRSGWFVESVASAATVVLVVRTRRPCFRSRPARPLVWATAAVVMLAFALPFLPIAGVLGFQPLPPSFLALVAVIVVVYVVAAEITKRLLRRHVGL